MCTVKVEDCAAKATIGPVGSGCGGLDIAAPGAKTEQGGSEHPTPTQAPLALPKPIKDEEDDPLTYLTALFDLATLDESEDSDDCSESGSEDDEWVPSSPRSKGFENKHCFYASGCLYYFDDFRRVYTQDGLLMFECSFESQLEDLLSASFFINTVPYWFDEGGLLSQDNDGSLYRVHTWLSEPDLLDLENLLSQPPIPQVDVAVFEPNSNPGSFYGTEPIPMTMPPSDYYTTPKSKPEVLSPNAGLQSLQQSFQGGPKPLMWSPSSSDRKSPIVPTTTSRESSMGPSLFPESQTVMGSIPIVTKWQQELVQAQKDAERARPVKKPGKEDRRRCPICNKLFRRPSSLEDHLNVHSGDKPHTCPFKGCNTGFATKSNMKRHFITHRVGPLERYRPGMACPPSEPYGSSPTKTGKAPRAPTATYNSKSYHNGRFRISA